MAAQKYVARLGYGNSLTVVEIEKETDVSVWINGRRNAKRSSYDNYFDSWQEAHDFLREDAEKDLLLAKRRLDAARSKLEEIRKLKPIT